MDKDEDPTDLCLLNASLRFLFALPGHQDVSKPARESKQQQQQQQQQDFVLEDKVRTKVKTACIVFCVCKDEMLITFH